MDTIFPPVFSEEDYVAWHESRFEEDRPLKNKLEELRESLKIGIKNDFIYLSNILYELSQHCEAECDIQTKQLATGRYVIPIISEVSQELPDKYFKPTNSIINKLWRKNVNVDSKRTPGTHLGNIRENITDLIRTSVIAPSFFHAREFATRLKDIKRIIRNPQLSERFDSTVTSLVVDDEAKLAAGYFAYHSLIKFADGFCIEIQIYSQLTSSWRDLSHKIYEKTRLGERLLQDLGSPESRFVSLGHLLYMADCEFERLLKELREKI